MLYQVHLAWAGFELTTLVVIGTDGIGKSKYHTITTTTSPNHNQILLHVYHTITTTTSPNHNQILVHVLYKYPGNSLWKDNLNSNCQQIHQYQSSPHTSNNWTQKKKTTYDIENPGPGYTIHDLMYMYWYRRMEP
jgi:hypothetical protein